MKQKKKKPPSLLDQLQQAKLQPLYVSAHGEQDCVELSTLMYFSFSQKGTASAQVGKMPAEKTFQGWT